MSQLGSSGSCCRWGNDDGFTASLVAEASPSLPPDLHGGRGDFWRWPGHLRGSSRARANRLLDSELLRLDPFLTENEILSLLVEGVKDEDECIDGVKHGRSWGDFAFFGNHFFEPATGAPRQHRLTSRHSGVLDAAEDYGDGARGVALGRSVERLSSRDVGEPPIGLLSPRASDASDAGHDVAGGLHDDPHGYPQALVGCGGDIDHFEMWGFCSGFSNRINDYVVDSAAPLDCDGEVPPPTLTCRLWWSLQTLWDGEPQGAPGSLDPVVKSASNRIWARPSSDALRRSPMTSRNSGCGCSTTPTSPTFSRPASCGRARGSTINDCGAGVVDRGLCDTGGAGPSPAPFRRSDERRVTATATRVGATFSRSGGRVRTTARRTTSPSPASPTSVRRWLR